MTAGGVESAELAGFSVDPLDLVAFRLIDLP